MRTYLIVAALLLGGATSPSAAPATPLAIQAFAQSPMLSSPLLSPDGHLIAARSKANGEERLLIYNADDPSSAPRAFPLGKAILSDVNWAGSKRILLSIILMANLDGFPVERLIGVDVDSGATRILDKRGRGIYGGRVLYVDPNGAFALVASQNSIESTPSVKRVDLATGGETIVENPLTDVWDWFADAQGVVRAGIRYDDKQYTIWYRERDGEPLRPIRGKFDNDDSTVDSIKFDASGQALVITNAKTGRFALYKYNVATGAVGAPVYENPTVDISNILLDSKGELSAVSYEDDRRRTYWFDPKLRDLQGQLDKVLPGAENDVVDMSADQSRVLVWSGGAADPGAYYLLNRTSRQMRPLFAAYSIDPNMLSAVKAVSYNARDGLEIPAYLTLPRDRTASKLPLIVLPHGGPFARDDWEYDPLVQFLASRGYAVLQPEFRGSTGYGRAFVERGYGQWGRGMQDDLDDGVDWLAKLGEVDPRRVCVVGASYGGYAALWAAIRNPDRYRCAVSFAGVTDLAAQLGDNRKMFSAARYFREWRTKVQGTANVDLASISPLQQAKRVKIPVLIAHGEDDDTVRVQQGHRMAEALQKAGADVESVFYKDQGHDWGNDEHRTDFLRRLDSFLARHNPAS